MKIDGQNIYLDPDELATAVDIYVYAMGVKVSGPRTISYRVDGERAEAPTTEARIYVDPSGKIADNRPIERDS